MVDGAVVDYIQNGKDMHRSFIIYGTGGVDVNDVDDDAFVFFVINAWDDKNGQFPKPKSMNDVVSIVRIKNYKGNEDDLEKAATNMMSYGQLRELYDMRLVFLNPYRLMEDIINDPL